MSFTKRTIAPSKSDKHYYSDNIFYQCGYGMPNCTCYAWGRAYELLGKKPKLSTRNAENWYVANDGYVRSSKPRVGAIACWRKGKVGNGSDGAGHVASVEEVYSNGDFLASESNYGGDIFRTKVYTKSNNYYISSSYTFQGFIYLPIEVDETPTSNVKYVYNCTSLNVRNGAGTSYKAINELVASTKVTEYEVKNGWSRIGNGQWVSSNYLTTNKPSIVYDTKEVTTTLNVRTSNSFSGSKNIAKEKCPLNKGTIVSMIETSGSGIRIGENRWVYKSYLK